MQTIRRFWNAFLKRGTKGKLVIGGLLLLFSCCLCSLPIAILAPNKSTPTLEPTAVSELGTPRPTSTPASTATIEPTNTSSSTNTPVATDTPVSTDKPTVERTEAKVVEVVDGDTIKVKVGGEVFTVRYIGVNTPETVHPTKPIEWMGPEAKRANEQLVAGQTVLLEKDVSEVDQYGRLLRYVYVGDLMVNHELVRMGFAQVATYPPDVKYVDMLREVQREAQEAKRGLWSATPTPTPTQAPRATATTNPTPTQPPTIAPTQPPTAVPTQVPQSTATALPPTVAPTPPPQPTEPPATPGDVVIQYIFYDGVVPRVESDEYAEIVNRGGSSVNLAGWRLNAGADGQDFWFPALEIQPGQTCRIYTNESHPESCGGLTFGSGQALWNNKGDCGRLFDSSGTLVSEYCY